MEPPSESTASVLEVVLSLFNPVTPGIGVALALMVLLLFASAMISGSEVAYFSLGPGDLAELENGKSKKGLGVIELLKKPQRLLATILITNNFVNIAIVLLSTYVVEGVFNFTEYPLWLAITIQVVAVTFLILLFGEVMPKVYASANARFLSLVMASPLILCRKLFYPLSSILVRSTSLIHKKIKPRNKEFSSDELEQAIELTKDEDTTPDEEKILIGIARFGNTDVKQIMTPRTETVAFEYNTPYNELLPELIEHGYSRLPVYRESFDNVAGVLYLKDLLPYVHRDDFDWQNLLRQPFFVPENKKIDDLLKEFQERKIHLAIVVDEHGGMLGIVSLEDVIEEIVGDITDEFDEEEIIYSKLDEKNYIFEGKTQLIDLYRILEIDGSEFEERKGDSETLAGFILELAGRIPQKHEKLRFGRFLFVIEASDKRKIKRVKISLEKPVNAEEEDHE